MLFSGKEISYHKDKTNPNLNVSRKQPQLGRRQKPIMKKLIAIACLICLCKTSYSQVLIALAFGDKLQTGKLEFGLSVNPGFSSISNIQCDPKFGLGLALYFNVKFSEDFFLHLEASPKLPLGAKGIAPYPTGNDSLDFMFETGSIERNIKAMSVPLLARYRITGKLFAEAGPQIDWILKVKDIYEATVNGSDLTYTTKVTDQFTKFDVGLAGGLSYKLKKDKGVALGFRYYYGMTDIMKTVEGNQANRQFSFLVAISVGVGKAERRAEMKRQQQGNINDQ